MTVKKVIENFYKGLAQKKDDVWQQDLSEDIIFSDASKKLQSQGREAFIQSFTSFLRGVNKVEVKQLIVEEPNACVVVSYEYISPKGDTLYQEDAEVWKIEDGKIVALTIYFDITEFRTFMKGGE